jgi:predicted deacylase
MYREVGRSKLGAPIHLASIGQGTRSVLFIGSIHGDEPQGTDLIYRMMRDTNRYKGLLSRNRFLAIPNANPDGYARRIRTNLNGVDLNRNFPTRWRKTARGRFFSGPKPLSEPESQVLARVVDEERPQLIVAFHAHMACNNYDGAGAAPIARAMARSNGYRLLPFIGYETPGSLGQFASNGRGIPIVTLEVGFETPDQLWRKVRESLLVALDPSVRLSSLN